jgi:hypothetical protein
VNPDDEETRHSEPPAERGDAPEPYSPPAVRRDSSNRRALVLGAAVVVPLAVIGLSLFSILRDTAPTTTPVVGSVAAGPVAPAETATQAPTTAPVAPPAALPSAPSLDVHEAPLTDFYEDTDDGEPAETKPAPPKHYKTVHQAATESCTTASVEALSRQIIEQARCIKPNAFVPLPSRPNLVLASNVFPYLEADARKHLLRALDSQKSGTMTINSALRTVAQQYLVSRWAAGRRCGVQLATHPGESNHEIGMALDIAEPGRWRSALEAEDFKWLGATDRVHFDYKGTAAPARTATDVLAFQMLWNKNNPKDKIATDGRYDAGTEKRMKQAPPAGFPLGPSCGKSAAKSP